METPSMPILTPDQRLRVFVSSTLQELAPERTAARQAIHQLHLTPVMFEMGARPYAPRDLYRQYLSQSQLFIGIYWDKYGWVAPTESVSGLEDEYNLSGDMPKLIYIKKSAGQREERLTHLLKKIQSDDRVSYKSFETPEELHELIVNDLAIVLTEHFNTARFEKNAITETTHFPPIPAPPNSLIGRESTVHDILALCNVPSKRLITLVGPGGIGKTRLAIEIAGRLQNQHPDGTAFVSLAPVRDVQLVPESICFALGIKISGGNTLESLKLFLRDKKMLLVLDNFEQIIDAASVVDTLLRAAPQLRILVTSRERLALSFEHVFIVPALQNICDDEYDCMDILPPAVELFVERVKAIQPGFRITPQNRNTICEISCRLEGLPLAIELAAGQINLFSPATLLQKLDHSLDVLKGNFRDIPGRQRTMRDTIAWSFDLLCQNEQMLLLQISLYHAGCVLDAVTSMDSLPEQDVHMTLNNLINKSLVVREEDDLGVRFQMLESVREFAQEKLEERGLLETYLDKQADYYHHALMDIKIPRDQSNHAALFLQLEKEHPNIRQSLDYLLQQKDLPRMIDISWNLWLFWWVNAHTREGYIWLKKIWDLQQQEKTQLSEHTFAILACNVGIMSFLQRDYVTFSSTMALHLDLILKQNDDELVATSMLITGVAKTVLKEYHVANEMLDVSLERFQKIGLTAGVSYALSALGRNAAYDGGRTQEAKEYYRESLALARQSQDDISVIIALSGFALCEVFEKNAAAKPYLEEVIRLSQSLHFYEALAWSIEIWALAYLNEGNAAKALTLMAAVSQLRTVAQLPAWEDLQEIMVDARKQLEEQLPPAVVKEALETGTMMSVEKVIRFVQEDHLSVNVDSTSLITEKAA